MDKLPEFPKTSAPYFNFLKSEAQNNGHHLGNSEFARMQRESIERYLVELIRAVMFHPSANRLCRFLEVSALSLSMAQSGGWQHKGGILRIEPVGKTGAFSRRGLGWREKRKSRWCAVRESFLVVMEQAGELRVHDVFLLDSDFSVERPTRYLRKGLHMLHLQDEEEPHGPANPETRAKSPHTPRSLSSSRRHSINGRGSVSVNGHHSRKNSMAGSTMNKASLTLRKIFTVGSRHTRRTSHSSSNSSATSRAPTPLEDPSTQRPAHGPHSEILPEDLEKHIEERIAREKNKKKKNDSKEKDLSHRTFYIENSQMRLKLTARNEVCYFVDQRKGQDLTPWYSAKWTSGSQLWNGQPRQPTGRRKTGSIAFLPFA